MTLTFQQLMQLLKPKQGNLTRALLTPLKYNPKTGKYE